MPPPKKKKAKSRPAPKTQNSSPKSSKKKKTHVKPEKPTTTTTSAAAYNIYGYHELTQNQPNWADGLANPLSTTQTFAEALRVTDAARDRLMGLLPGLPRRGAAMYRPTTLSEATSYVNAREDAKKKQGVARLDGDVVAVPAESYRGSHPGVAEGDGEAAAFWLYTSDFFRDFCVEDAVELLAFLGGPEELGEFRLAELRARPPEALREILLNGRRVDTHETTALLDKPVIQPQRRQRRDSQKSQRAAGYVFSTPSLSSSEALRTEADDVALAKALSLDALARKKEAPKTTTVTAPKATLQKLDKALQKLAVELKTTPATATTATTTATTATTATTTATTTVTATTTATATTHPWTRQLLYETRLPSHVVHSATEPYYLDPPGSLTQENLANLVKHTEKVTEEVNRFIHQSSHVSNEQAIEVMAMAPQDELAAETLALQSELAAVMASNRGKLMEPLSALVEDIAVQDKKRKERELDEAFGTKFFDRLTRMASTKMMKTTTTMATMIHNNPEGMATIRNNDNHHHHPSEEAFCAVCADGFSAPPNVILFCDRCDVPVHQQCYNIVEIPQHEWLCWPCREHEDELLRQGKTREEIRPPSVSLEHRSHLPGGSKEAECALCPIKGGAFRKTVDGTRWVHQACAVWHPEVGLKNADECAVVTNLDKIPDERLNSRCSICGQAQGAIINCPKIGCANKYHVVCAKNCGLYFSLTPAGKASKVFCAEHGAAEQEKDSVLLAKRLAGVTPKMTKASQRKAQEDIRRRDLVELQRLENELYRMQALRLNLEQVRQLLDLCKRREKIKKSYAMAVQEAYKMERVLDPSGTLELLEKLDSYATPIQALAEVYGVSTPIQPITGLGAASPSLQLTPGGGVMMADGSALYTLVDERVSKAGRPRRVAATIERERVLTINEAETLNSSLPQGVRYVRLNY